MMRHARSSRPAVLGATAVVVCGAVLAGCASPTAPVAAAPTRSVAATTSYCAPWPQPAFPQSPAVVLSGPGWPREPRDLMFSVGQPRLWKADVTKVVFDFLTPGAGAPGVGPGQTMVLIHARVTGTDPGWQQPVNRFELAAWLPSQPGASQWVTVCPESNPRLDAAMSAAGYPPLPAPGRSGDTVTGWLAFPIPRTATALTLRTTGGTAEGDAPIMRRQPGDTR